MSDEFESRFVPHDVVWDDQKIARYWDYLSKVPAALDNCWSKQVGRALLRYVARNGALRGQILDYGCGPGFLISDLLQMVPDAVIYGVEHSQESVRMVNQQFSGQRRFGGVVSGATIPTTYDDGYFDTVFFVETIEHLQPNQRPMALRELRRLLRPGGMVVVTTPNDEDMDGQEGCLSIPGLMFDCKRKANVVAHGQNMYGDPITVEQKYKDSRTVRLHSRLLVSANWFPRSSDSSPGFFRRWLVLKIRSCSTEAKRL